MQRTSRLALAALLLVASCSTVPGTYVEPDGPPDTVAVVRGGSPSFLSAVNPLKPLGSTLRDVRLVTVDGETLTRSSWDGLPTEVRVTPGLHTIGVNGEIELEGTLVVRGEDELSRYFLAGQTYGITVELSVIGDLIFTIEALEED